MINDGGRGNRISNTRREDYPVTIFDNENQAKERSNKF
jgi:hypothetical protein